MGLLRRLNVNLHARAHGARPKLSPLQERAWDAFNVCKEKAPSAVLNQIYDDDRLSFSAREGDIGIMQRCLQEKFDYRFR